MVGADDSDERTRQRATAAAPRPSADATRQRHRLPGEATGAGDETQARGPVVAGAQVHNPRVPLEPGMVIRRRYVLDCMIGSGGMGQVWKAKDLVSARARDPNPFVALKLLNADFEAEPDAFVSLQRETRKAQELAHPNVATVYAFDIDDGASGRAFMSMELLEGASLDAMLRQGPAGLSRLEALPLILGMARGLEYAHRKGLVHSDFKPGNVFLTRDGVPKVLDFGIARAATIAGVERRTDSFDAGTLGGLTLAYASPEMIEHLGPHPADDVYGLGLVAYELLTGRHPFKRLAAVEARNNGMKPERIRVLRRYEWQALARALDFDRAKRWPNAGEFLRAYAGKSVAATVLAVVALALAVAAGAFWYQARTEAGPSVPFESLPADVRQEFREHMANADGEWRLVQEGNGDESLNAASEYGKAYALHPRNADATAGLKKSADYVLNRLNSVGDRNERLRQLKSLQALSDFYANYEPLGVAIENAGGGR